MILGDQFGDCVMMFNTSFSYHIVASINDLVLEFEAETEWKGKLDALFAYTHTIKQHDCWIHDHEVGWDGPEMLSILGRLWKETLSKSNTLLGIDSEFTRPGIVSLLEQFKDELRSSREDMGDYESLHEDFAYEEAKPKSKKEKVPTAWPLV
eukprot:TRINITY_DN3250_c0_g1_i1.p1 TRINITY_DN3250_c0_g1~~TRINITY_DN3250_c0_g1_i1.p1  ORF type:complete len:152 (-),score=44.95 TRINITY_DN3250_c0_g1_i1:27-482(-)